VLPICFVLAVPAPRRPPRQVHAAASAELGRLGTVVHEGIAQDLAGVSLLLGTITGRSKQDAELLERISAHVSDVITLTRALARGLSPVQVAGGSLTAALSQYGKELAARRGIDFSCRPVADLPALGPVQAHQLFRIAGEALDWVADADGCRRVRLHLNTDGDSLVVEIVGDGRPEPERAEPETRLSTATYLARLLGGRLETQRLPAGGRKLVFTQTLGSAEDGGAADAPASRHD